MNEFDLIRSYFAPLAKHFSGSLNLSDDAAVFSIPAGHELVVTKDAIAEGVHYHAGTNPALIARKLLRMNLSDVAAMGATPLCYFLTIALPALDEHFIARFAEGLAQDQKIFGIYLAGGDTIACKGAPVFSLTAHGTVPQGKALRRSGARAGDAVYVSGTLGDAALGLTSVDAYLKQRYELPEPRLQLGMQLRAIATSCMDISDGLLQDLGHICKASNVGAEIYQEQLPLSDAAKKFLGASPELWPLIYSGGDDYELLFTLPEGAAAPSGTTRIGRMTEGNNVRLLNHGMPVPVSQQGYRHS